MTEQIQTVTMGLAVANPDAVKSGRLDLIAPDPDGWLSVADCDELNREGAEVVDQSVTIADPDDDSGLFIGTLILWRGGYFVVAQ